MNEHYARMAAAIDYMRRNLAAQPSLERVAAHAGLSPYHFQRLFRRWVGISPKRYLEFLTVHHAKRLLPRGSVLTTAHDLGLSGPSRLHEQFVAVEALSPGEFKGGARGTVIEYGFAPGPFADVLIAQSRRGICLLAFVEAGTRDLELQRLRRLYPGATLAAAPARAAETAAALFGGAQRHDGRIHLAVRGTNLQVNVWRALLRIPPGMVVSYQHLAHAVGASRAVRAVANAVAANPVHFLIPCHRVIRSDGALGGFRAGTGLKGRLLDAETAAEGPVRR